MNGKIKENVAIKERLLILAWKNLSIVCFGKNSAMKHMYEGCSRKKRQCFLRVINMVIEHYVTFQGKKWSCFIMFLEWPNTSSTWFVPGRFYSKSCLCSSLLTTMCHDSPTTQWRTGPPSAHRSFPLSVELLWIHPMSHRESQNTTSELTALQMLVRNQAQPQKQKSHSPRRDPAKPFQCSISFLPTLLAHGWPDQPKWGSHTFSYGSPGRKSEDTIKVELGKGKFYKRKENHSLP